MEQRQTIFQSQPTMEQNTTSLDDTYVLLEGRVSEWSSLFYAPDNSASVTTTHVKASRP